MYNKNQFKSDLKHLINPSNDFLLISLLLLGYKPKKEYKNTPSILCFWF